MGATINNESTTNQQQQNRRLRTTNPFLVVCTETQYSENLRIWNMFHVYLNKCEFRFSRLDVNKINNFCFLLNNGRVPGMAK